MTDAAPARRRVLVIGRGRMGRLVESLSGEYGFDVAGWVDRENAGRSADWPDADVAIDFSTGDAVAANFSALARRGHPVVIGATGWGAHEAAIRHEAEARGIAVVAAPNFALGVSLFGAIVARAAELMSHRSEFGAWVHELHHATKRDAPSGTALGLMEIMLGSGYRAPIRCLVDAGGGDPRDAHDWLRRGRRDHHADAYGARSKHLRARRARGGPLGRGTARVVHHGGCSGVLGF